MNGGTWFRCLARLFAGTSLAVGLSFAPPSLFASDATVIEPLVYLGGDGHDLLFQPSAAVRAPSGEIYVLDGARHRIQVFGRDGALRRTLGEDAGFSFPLGLALDRSGERIFVADSGNSRIVELGPDGAVQLSVQLPAEGLSRSPDPTDILPDEDRNRLYVVDNDNHRLLVYTLDTLEFQASVDRKVAAGGLRWPYSLAKDHGGRVFLVDVINTVVHSFDPDFSPGVSYGGWGVTKGNFFRPTGVAVDGDGRLFVSDSYLGVIQIFRPEGGFHSVLADETGAIWRFDNPVRLSMDDDGHLLVVEMMANRVGVFRVGE